MQAWSKFMKFLSSAFGFHEAKLHLANYKAAREENQLLRLFIILERKMNFKFFFLLGMMYVAITRRGSGERSPPDVGMVTQILAPPT